MKRFVTAFGIGALLLTPQLALANNWTSGGSTSDWQTASNWSGIDYPGQFFTGDTATIDNSTNNPVTLNSNLGNSIANLDLDAPTATAAVSLELKGNLTVTSTTTVTGDNSASKSATITMTSGTFDPAALTLDGGDSNAREARFLVNGGTLTMPDSTVMRSYVELNVANGQSANFGDTHCDATTDLQVVETGTGICQTEEFKIDHASDTAITVTKTGVGTLGASSFIISGSANQNASLVVSAGSVFTE